MDIQLLYKQLWNNWDVRALILLSPSIQIILTDIRVLILLSLSIQIILIFLSPMRRTFNSRLIQMFLWGSYLLADWVAVFVLGKLSHSVDDSSASNAIIVFWAPFLILHLGGPDTITAYSMEDNELWARHLLGLIYELIIAFYVLICSLPNSHLVAPTLLMFLVAIIKYVERSYSLYKASIKGFHSSISSFKRIYPEKDLNTLNKAFWLYSANKPSFIDVFPHKIGYSPTKNFMNYSPRKDILRVMSMELSYAYDEFYTKAIVSHSRAGYFLRVLCSICMLLAFSLFVMMPKDDFKYTDVVITYVLLIASICLDVVAAVMFVFSNWMVVSLLNVKRLSNWSMGFAEHIVRIKRRCHKRSYWMIKMPQLNLLTNCLIISTPKKAPINGIMNWVVEKLSLVQGIINWVAEKLGLMEVKKLPKSLFDSSDVEENYMLQTMQPVQATQEILEIIASNLIRDETSIKDELKKPAGISALKKVSIAEWVVPILIQLFSRMPFDQQVLVWHITTELCFQCNLEPQYNNLHLAWLKKNEHKFEGEMKACKYLSDYIMHLVVIQSDMMSTMREVSSQKFWETIHEIVKITHKSRITEVKELCKKIMDTPIDWHKPSYLIALSRVLAHLMFFITKHERWQVMTCAWVDLLSTGATNLSARTQVKQLTWGNELLTLIWLFYKQKFVYDVFESDNLFYTVNNISQMGKDLQDQVGHKRHNFYKYSFDQVED